MTHPTHQAQPADRAPADDYDAEQDCPGCTCFLSAPCHHCLEHYTEDERFTCEAAPDSDPQPPAPAAVETQDSHGAYFTAELDAHGAVLVAVAGRTAAFHALAPDVPDLERTQALDAIAQLHAFTGAVLARAGR